MNADGGAIPDDIAALKEALAIERAKALEVAAELAVARAKASEDSALIAQQKLRIAKLERQIYGQRSERSSRLIDQLALTFEELEADATEDELAAERAAARTTTVRGFTRKRAADVVRLKSWRPMRRRTNLQPSRLSLGRRLCADLRASAPSARRSPSIFHASGW